MNIFRLAGDLVHLWSIVILLLTMNASRSCAGISLKTQELYLIVFATRYLDIFWKYYSIYNSLMKLFFVGSAAAVVYMMKRPLRRSHDKEHDRFRIAFLIVPSAVLALIFHYKVKWLALVPELLWTFSIYLEAVAILPQLFLLQETKDVENITAHYIAALGSYRALYILNWMWRILFSRKYRNPIVWVAGFVQTVLYADFFYYFLQSRVKGQKMVLPS